jgi:hypothetical protein
MLTMDKTTALALEAEGDISYRVRVVRCGDRGRGQVGEVRYRSTLDAARAAVPGIVDRWGKYVGNHTHRAAMCDVLIEARERTYYWDGQQMQGVNARPWHIVDVVTVATGNEVAE